MCRQIDLGLAQQYGSISNGPLQLWMCSEILKLFFSGIPATINQSQKVLELMVFICQPLSAKKFAYKACKAPKCAAPPHVAESEEKASLHLYLLFCHLVPLKSLLTNCSPPLSSKWFLNMDSYNVESKGFMVAFFLIF